MVRKPTAKLPKKKSKHHGTVRDELVTVKSDLILLAPEYEDIEVKRPVGATGHRTDELDPEAPHTGTDALAAGVCKSSRATRAGWACGKLLLLIALLYLFICSLDLLASAFRLLGGRTASAWIRKSTVLSNPVVGLMIGVLVTVLVQSSSTSSSIIVSMVAADFMDVRSGVPIIMGANIGTSVTNTIVSIGQVSDREQFRLAFSGAIVHDMFNWLCVLVLLPLEAATGYLYIVSKAALSTVTIHHNDVKVELLSRITKPFTHTIVKLDKAVLTGWTMNDPTYENATLLRRFCPDPQADNSSQLVTCNNLAAHLPLSDMGMGFLLLVVSLVMLIGCLLLIVKILSSMLKGSVKEVIQNFINADLPRVPWLTGYLAIIAGAVMTFVLQSSSIFTSTLTPLVGLGMITVERMYPLTLGSNLGTTTTALLAALASDASRIHAALQIALVHLFFNLTGLLMWYPIPFLRLPIRMAYALGTVTAKYRWFAVLYMILSFGLIPLFVFVVSLGGALAMYCVFVPITVIAVAIAFINVAQVRFPKYLPSKLRTWHWLPLPLRSLQPIDDLITRLMCCNRNATHKYAHVPPAASVPAPHSGNESTEIVAVIEPPCSRLPGLYETDDEAGDDGKIEVQVHTNVLFVQHETST